MKNPSEKGISRVGIAAVLMLGLVIAVAIGTGMGLLFPGIGTSVKEFALPPFDGKDVIKVLIIGEDNTGGTKEKPYGLSDTIMLASIDFTTKKISALSIPRDTRVEIPNYGVCKINAAHVYGGPLFTSLVVEDLLRIKPDYYIKTNVEGFKETVDLVGGVEIDVEKNMRYDDSWGNLHINLKKGLQVLKGEDAMGYVRFRHDKLGDITRMERQQKFIKALAKKMVEPASLPKLPWTIKSVMRNIDTNMSSKELLHLANFARSINMDEITMERLPGTPQNIGGASYWIADEEETYVMVSTMFLSRNINGLPRVEVLNGSGILGAAQKAAEDLQQSGYEITSIGNADSFDYASTMIISHKEDISGIDQISQIINTSVTKEQLDPSANADITIIIGKDYIL